MGGGQRRGGGGGVKDTIQYSRTECLSGYMFIYVLYKYQILGKLNQFIKL